MASKERKLTRVGLRSICVVIPAEFIDELGWRERQIVTIDKRGSTLTIKDYKPRKTKKRIST